MIPQLRVRTEYSFKSAYGGTDRVADRLREIKCPAAGIVDTHGTWGHVDWEKSLGEDVVPLYGAEFSLTTEDGRRPRFWALAGDLPAFYRFSSSAPLSAAEIEKRGPGVIVFAGAALTNPDHFDYIDINPRSRRRTEQALKLAEETGKPLVITSDNDYPAPDDYERFLAWDDSKKMTPQHILTEQELRAALWYVDDDTFAAAVANTHDVAARIGRQKLRSAPIISVDGDFDALVEAGKAHRIERGHIPEWTDEYQKRMDREVAMIKQKEYESYFMVVADMIVWAKQRMLVGPGRGSSAGSLVCFLLQITEVDPLVHNLIFERFIDVNRSDLPDIDVDFNDKKREQVFEYLAEKYGRENVARIGSINRMKPRSVLAHVGKKMGIPKGSTFNVVNVLIEHSSGDARYGNSLEDTMTQTQPGKDFARQFPEASAMTDIENHASHTGVHAAGFIVSNVPVVEYCTVRDGIAQIEKPGAERLNLLKIDILGLRTLGVIEDSGVVTPAQLFDLKLDDPEVFRIYNERKYSGLFQFEGAAQRSVAISIPVTSFRQLDHITALARPGPLGAGAADTYIRRNNGQEPVTYRHPSMAEYLADTVGVVLYQEQVMRISFEIGNFPWEVVSEIRKAMSGSKGEEYFNRRGDEFVEGAMANGLSESEAREIWGEIVTFGGWGMNKSHTVSYSIISYWCAYMKRYHPLEYAAALLRNAKDDEQTVEMLRELTAEGVPFIPFDPEMSEANWVAKDGKLIGGFTNLVGIGPIKAEHYIQKRAAGGLTDKDHAALSKLMIKHNDLTPAHTRWKDIYENPSDYNINGVVREFGSLKDRENAVVICRAIKVDRRDDNEERRVHKRGYRLKGQTLFLDMFCVDDSVAKPVRVRIGKRDWNRLGERAADRLIPGEDWFLIRGTWLEQFNMMNVDKIKCLTNERMFE